MNEEDKLIQEQLVKLPSELRRALLATPWKHILKEIGQTNALNSQELIALEQEVLIIIYGFEPPEKFIDNLINNLKLSEVKALDLAEAIEEKIFKSISEKAEKFISTPNLPEIAPETHPVIINPPNKTTSPLGIGRFMNNHKFKASEPIKIPAIRPELEVEAKVAPRPEAPKTISTPDYRYPGGIDPYREPTK